MSQSSIPRPKIQYMDTAEAYNLWSQVYDTDGNFLQALDNIEMAELFPLMLSQLDHPRPWRIVDLGCGTGRNTVGILSIANAQAICLDVSPKMLEIAKSRIRSLVPDQSPASTPDFALFDMMDNTIEPPVVATNADAIISTLVIEHVTLDRFCETAIKMLKPGGLLLITNMHADMGQISQAGFTDPATKIKIRPTSFVHTISDLIQTASTYGLELVGEPKETMIDRHLADQIGSRAEKWIGIKVWFGALFRRASA